MSKVAIMSKGLLPTELTVITDDSTLEILLMEFAKAAHESSDMRLAEINVDPKQVKMAFDGYDTHTARNQVDDIDAQILELQRQKSKLLKAC